MPTNETRARVFRTCCWHSTIASLCCALSSGSMWAAERDICENKAGQELIRCIEAAARGPGANAPVPATPTAPAASAPVAVPPRPVPAQQSLGSPAEDCTGRSGNELRRCLAAGGRLSSSAAVPGNTPAAAAPSRPLNETCDGKSTEALRLCIEAAAKAPQKPATPAQPQIVACTRYTTADHPLCVHRNEAIATCRNKQKYPDADVCLRSFMVRAPQPARADCGKLPQRAQAHCEARNQVFQSCAGDKLGYFACLEHRLGADAALPGR